MRALVLIFILCSNSVLQAQDKNIQWSETRKLKYEDFEAPVPNGVNKMIRATTSAVIEVKYEQAGDKVNVTVWCYFRKDDSWIRSDSKDAYTLKHEQGHFDIAEIYTRLIRKKLSETKLYPRKNGKEIGIIFKKYYYRKYFSRQKKYDKATSHAVKEKNQAEWIQMIAEELKSLEAYKDPTVMMGFK